MSIKSKDLSYNTSNEPAFLRRLRAQNSGQDDRHERPVARPQRLQKDTEDDDPTYVVEGSDETLSKAEYEALVSGKPKDGSETADGEFVGVTGEPEGSEPKASGALPDVEEDEAEAERKKKKRMVEAGAGNKKRKVAKVVGADEEEGGKQDGDGPKETKSVSKKAKKKGKPIKLSFEDE